MLGNLTESQGSREPPSCVTKRVKRAIDAICSNVVRIAEAHGSCKEWQVR